MTKWEKRMPEEISGGVLQSYALDSEKAGNVTICLSGEEIVVEESTFEFDEGFGKEKFWEAVKTAPGLPNKFRKFLLANRAKFYNTSSDEAGSHYFYGETREEAFARAERFIVSGDLVPDA